MSLHFVTNERIAETSSKGNQEKWLEGNRWYKLDQFGYEALAETLISQLLELSNCEKDYPFRFTRYRMERFSAHGIERTGCSSENFLLPDQSIITLSHLYKRESEVSLRDLLSRQSSDKKRIAYLADATAELTDLELFPQYLTLLFEVDALFLNDDRHLKKVSDDMQQHFGLPHGKFDNVSAARYAVPDVWTMGKVYARLIEDVSGQDDVVETLVAVYTSWIDEKLCDYNSSLYYQSRDYIAECYRAGHVIDA